MPETVLYSLEDLSRILRVGTEALKKEIEMGGLKKMVPRNSFPKQIMQMPAWKLHGIIYTLWLKKPNTIYCMCW